METNYLGADPVSRKQTFWGSTQAQLTTALAAVDAAEAGSASYAGIAVHDRAGWEALKRRVTAGTCPALHRRRHRRLWEVFLHRYGTRRSGAAEALRAVIAADPGLAVARAAAALLAAFAGESFDVEAEIAAARRGTKAHDWERSLVEATMTLVSQGMWPSRPSWERHHDRFPGDLLGFELVIFLTLMSTDPGARAAALERALRTEAVVGEHPQLLGFRGMLAQDVGDLDEAHRLAARALELDPTGFSGGHPMTHVYFEGGDHAAGADWLDGWLPTTDQEADFGSHLVWHSALHHLALGHQDTAIERYRHCAGRAGPGGLVDGTSMLWRCQMHGLVPPGADPAEVRVSEVVAPLTRGRAVHVRRRPRRARPGHRRGRRRPAPVRGRTRPASPRPGAPSCCRTSRSAWRRTSRGTTPRPATGCWRASGTSCGSAGSHAQREVFEDTLIQALIRAGRLTEASTRLQARLDRRESPLDAALLARTHGSGEAVTPG